MAQYINIGGVKNVQFDDGSTAPVFVGTSLEGGTLTKLTDTQIASLRSPVYPNEYPIPSAQLAALLTPAISNFPSSFSISNFPGGGFACSNLPASYPLPSGQESMLSGLQATVGNFSKGLAVADANTLRVVVASDQPAIFTGRGRMSAITRSASGDFTVISPSSGSKVLRIASITLSAPTGNSLLIRQGTVGEGQTDLSGAIAFQSLALDFGAPIALTAGRSFVLNLATASTVTGYAVTWEE